MADKPQPIDVAAVSPLIIDPLQHAIAAGCRKALELGVPAHKMVEMQLNQLASIVALIEPAGARAGLTKDIVRQFAGMVEQHVRARYTTAGGVILPREKVA